MHERHDRICGLEEALSPNPWRPREDSNLRRTV